MCVCFLPVGVGVLVSEVFTLHVRVPCVYNVDHMCITCQLFVYLLLFIVIIIIVIIIVIIVVVVIVYFPLKVLWLCMTATKQQQPTLPVLWLCIGVLFSSCGVCVGEGGGGGKVAMGVVYLRC